MKRILAFILFLLVFPRVTSAEAPPDGRLVIGVSTNLSRISPFETTSTASANIIEILFSSLVNLNPDLTPKPSLATEWRFDTTTTSWTFVLQDNIAFHDGKRLTSDDVVFTFNTLKSRKQSLFQDSLNNIISVEAKDARTVTFKLNQPDQSFFVFISQFNIAPKHLFKPDGTPISPDYYQAPVGSGPFLAKSVTEQTAYLTANERYFKGKPKLAEILFEVHKSERALLSSLITGQIDMRFFYDNKYQSIAADIPHLLIVSYNNQYLYSVFFNLKNPLFKDKTVRQALNLAVNKHKLIERSQVHPEALASGVVPPASPHFARDIQPYPYEPEKALELFQSSGWRKNPLTGKLEKNGAQFSFTVIVPQGGALETEIASIIQADLDELGIDMKVHPVPLNDLVANVIHNKTFEAAIFFYNNVHGILADRSMWTNSGESGFNFSSYDNPKVKNLLSQAAFSLHPEASSQAYHEFQKEIHDDPPMIYLFWKEFPLAMNRRVHGLQPNPYLMFRTIDRVWVDNAL